MTANGWRQIAVFFLLVLACAKPLGLYIAAVMEGRGTWLSPILAPCEHLIYRICGAPRIASSAGPATPPRSSPSA